MPYLGAHVSTAGGICTGIDRAEQISCEAFQLFAKNNKCWVDRPMNSDDVLRFRSRLASFPRGHAVSHAGYLINLAAGDKDIYRRSLLSMKNELDRAESLGLAWVVLHPGSHGGRGEEWGLRRVAAALQRLLNQTSKYRVGILLETTAGQGASLGWRFEHLAYLRKHLTPARRIGICVDTCHIFAAGYELRSKTGYANTMSELERVIGLKYVKFFHLNDSLKGFGSRVDRHEHIGKGEIGPEGFRFLMNDRRFKKMPMVLETPKGPDMKEDVMNLRILRKMAAA